MIWQRTWHLFSFLFSSLSVESPVEEKAGSNHRCFNRVPSESNLYVHSNRFEPVDPSAETCLLVLTRSLKSCRKPSPESCLLVSRYSMNFAKGWNVALALFLSASLSKYIPCRVSETRSSRHSASLPSTIVCCRSSSSGPFEALIDLARLFASRRATSCSESLFLFPLLVSHRFCCLGELSWTVGWANISSCFVKGFSIDCCADAGSRSQAAADNLLSSCRIDATPVSQRIERARSLTSHVSAQSVFGDGGGSRSRLV